MTSRKTGIAPVLAFLLVVLCGLLPSAAQALPPVERTVLPNKLVLLFFEEHSTPIVTFHMLFDAGSWRDPQGMEGLANLTAKGILLGTPGQDVSALNRELDYLGTSLGTGCDKDFAAVTMQSLKQNLQGSFALLLRVLTQASFPEAEIAAEKQKIAGEIKSDEDDPETVAALAFAREMYLSGPYAGPVKGTVESVAAIPRDTAANFHRDYYVPNNAILVIGGDITMDEVNKLLVPELLKWPERAVPKSHFMSAFPTATRKVLIDKDVSQASVMLGNAGMERSNKDYGAFSVMNYVLGYNNFTSRLMTEIRIKRGLAYSVFSIMVPRKHPAAFEIVLQTKNPSASEAISLALGEMEKIRRERVSDAELELAKKALIGSFAVRYSTQKEIAKFFAQVEYFGLGLDYPHRYPDLINAVTREDVLKAAQKYLHPDHYVLVVVGNLKEAGMEGKK